MALVRPPASRLRRLLLTLVVLLVSVCFVGADAEQDEKATQAGLEEGGDRVEAHAAAPRHVKEVLEVVTDETFQDVITIPAKDTLIKFYSPSCGHCKQVPLRPRTLAHGNYSKLSTAESTMCLLTSATSKNMCLTYSRTTFMCNRWLRTTSSWPSLWPRTPD